MYFIVSIKFSSPYPLNLEIICSAKALPLYGIRGFGKIAVWGKSKFQLYIGFFLFLYMLVITPILMSFFGISGVMISYGTSFLFAALIQSMFIFNFRKKNNFKNLILRE